MNKIPDNTLEWALNSIGANTKLLSQNLLKGATSSTLHLLNVKQGEVNKKIVLRRFTNKEWLAEEEDLAKHEAKALEMASRIDGSVPSLIAYDEFAENCEEPSVLMSYVEGKVVLEPPNLNKWLRGLATALVPIHKINGENLLWDYYPYENKEDLNVPVWAKHPNLWEKAIRILQNPWPPYQPVFIHRDYHPTNVLWKDGSVCGIVDWVNACFGPIGIDLGHCRINLVNLYGVEAADIFLDEYITQNANYQHHPYWDLISIQSFFGDEPLDMYSGWIDFGFPHLSKKVLVKRAEEYLASTLEKF